MKKAKLAALSELVEGIFAGDPVATTGIDAESVDLRKVDHNGKILEDFTYEESDYIQRIWCVAVPQGKFLHPDNHFTYAATPTDKMNPVVVAPDEPPMMLTAMEINVVSNLIDAPEPPPMSELVEPVEAVILPTVDRTDADASAIAKLDAKLRAMREQDEPIIQSSRKGRPIRDADDELIAEWMEANSGIFKK